ncbi:MAG: trigger factor [Sporichthyaceae bacterium]
MKSAVETLNPTRVRFTVEVDFDELKPSLDAAYKKIGSSVNVPGFRKGKVPPRIIDQRFGRGTVLDEAVNEALPRFLGEAVQASELEIIGRPNVDVTEFADGASLTFTAEVEVKPEITLPDYAGLAVTVDSVEVTDENIDEALVSLRERFATFTGADRPAADGDYLNLDLSGRTKDGELIDEAQATSISYVVGSGTLVPGIDEAVIGLSAQDKKIFSSTLIAGERKDEEVDIEVTVNSVKVRELPELDDEFVQSASEFDTVEALREDTRVRVSRQKENTQAAQARDKVLEVLLEQTEVPLPESFLAAEIEFRRSAITSQLQRAGLTLAAYLEHEGQTQEEFDADVATRASDAMKAQFVLDAVAKAEQVQVTQEEISGHIVARAQSSGMSPDQFAQQVVEAGQANMLVAEVVRGKALAVILGKATVTDSEGTAVDLGISVEYDHDHEGHDHEGHDHEGHDHDEAPKASGTPSAPGGAADISIPVLP